MYIIILKSETYGAATIRVPAPYDLCHIYKILQILPDDPGNNPHSHAPFFINPGDGKAHIILLAGSPVVIAGVGHSVHPLDSRI